MEYLDFEIEIGKGMGRDYPVAVIRSPAGEASETMRFPFDELALESRLKDLEIALLRSGSGRRQVLSREEQTVQDFGKDLFNALVGGEVRSRFDVSLREARQQGKGLRVKLRFQAPDLAALPWEFLYDQRLGEYLCLSKNTPTIRYLELPQFIPKLKVTPPLRILGMVASPADLPRLDVEREKLRIERAVQDLREKGFFHLEWLPGQTWRDLQETMARGGPWHIFHFIGHGGFDPDTDEGLIALADEQGQKKLLTATQLANLLADHYDLRLVLLNSCEGARAGKLDIYSSTAAILVRRGIAAVLAMQYEITDRAAIEFSRTFYQSLAYGMPIDAAVATARIAVNIEVNNSLEWGTPVLHMRSPDGVLFELLSIPADQPGTGIVEAIKKAPLPEPTPPAEARKSRLWVHTEPPKATVRILNFEAEFAQGMELEPGRYQLEVSADGYEVQRVWVELGAGEDKHISANLSQIRAPEPVEELKPETAEPKSAEPASSKPEPLKTKPAEPQEPEILEKMRRNRAIWIGIPAVLFILILTVGLWMYFQPGTLKTTAPVAKLTETPLSPENQSKKPLPVKEQPSKSWAETQRDKISQILSEYFSLLSDKKVDEAMKYWAGNMVNRNMLANMVSGTDAYQLKKLTFNSFDSDKNLVQVGIDLTQERSNRPPLNFSGTVLLKIENNDWKIVEIDYDFFRKWRVEWWGRRYPNTPYSGVLLIDKQLNKKTYTGSLSIKAPYLRKSVNQEATINIKDSKVTITCENPDQDNYPADNFYLDLSWNTMKGYVKDVEGNVVHGVVFTAVSD